MKEIKIVIPSHNRWESITTHKVIKNSVVCIAKSQVQKYRNLHPDMEIIEHPDTVVGLSAKRQWIYEKFGDVFMVDDDITAISCVFAKKTRKLSPEQTFEIIQNAYHFCIEAGIYLFGFSKNPNPIAYDVFKPIKLTGGINGSNFGIRKNKNLFFNHESVAVEDYWISGLNAFFNRKCYIDLRFCFVQKDTFHNVGGLSNFRTLESEKKDTLFLRKKFGEAIQIKNSTKLAKVFHQYGRTLTLPF